MIAFCEDFQETTPFEVSSFMAATANFALWYPDVDVEVHRQGYNGGSEVFLWIMKRGKPVVCIVRNPEGEERLVELFDSASFRVIAREDETDRLDAILSAEPIHEPSMRPGMIALYVVAGLLAIVAICGIGEFLLGMI